MKASWSPARSGFLGNLICAPACSNAGTRSSTSTSGRIRRSPHRRSSTSTATCSTAKASRARCAGSISCTTTWRWFRSRKPASASGTSNRDRVADRGEAEACCAGVKAFIHQSSSAIFGAVEAMPVTTAKRCQSRSKRTAPPSLRASASCARSLRRSAAGSADDRAAANDSRAGQAGHLRHPLQVDHRESQRLRDRRRQHALPVRARRRPDGRLHARPRPAASRESTTSGRTGSGRCARRSSTSSSMPAAHRRSSACRAGLRRTRCASSIGRGCRRSGRTTTTSTARPFTSTFPRCSRWDGSRTTVTMRRCARRSPGGCAHRSDARRRGRSVHRITEPLGEKLHEPRCASLLMSRFADLGAVLGGATRVSTFTAWMLILAAGVNSMIGNVLLKQSRVVARTRRRSLFDQVSLALWFHRRVAVLWDQRRDSLRESARPPAGFGGLSRPGGLRVRVAGSRQRDRVRRSGSRAACNTSAWPSPSAASR